MRARRRSGIASGDEAAASSSSAISARRSAPSVSTARRRPASVLRRRATVRSQAAGFSGTPLSGHWRSAAAKASDSASSAAATSRVRAARKATSRPKLSRATRSAARPASSPVSAGTSGRSGWADFDAARARARATRRPGDRLVEVRHVDQEIAVRVAPWYRLGARRGQQSLSPATRAVLAAELSWSRLPGWYEMPTLAIASLKAA